MLFGWFSIKTNAFGRLFLYNPLPTDGQQRNTSIQTKLHFADQKKDWRVGGLVGGWIVFLFFFDNWRFHIPNQTLQPPSSSKRQTISIVFVNP
jgi:hypothetical protein